MTTALDRDLAKLEGLAFYRAEWAEDVLRPYHAAISKLDALAALQVQVLYSWMFVPPTLWPFSIQDVLGDCLSLLEKGNRLPRRHRLIIDLLPEPPDEPIRALVAEYEWRVQKGAYENVVKVIRNCFFGQPMYSTLRE